MAFNFFDIIGFGNRREEEYSAVLRWLLDPEETHGLGSDILRSVLEKTGLPAEEMFSSDTVEVGVEPCYADEGGQRRLDIVIDTKTWHVVIENKIRESAMGNPAKLEHEYKAAAAKAKSLKKKFAFIHLYPDRFKDSVVLTPLFEAERATFKQLTWREAATILNGIAVENPDLQFTGLFLEQFSEYIKERVDMVFEGFNRDKETAFLHSLPEYQRAKAEFEKYKSVVSVEWKRYFEELNRMLAKDNAVTSFLTGGGTTSETTSWAPPYAVQLSFDVEKPIPARIGIRLRIQSGGKTHEPQIAQEVWAALWKRSKDYPALEPHLLGYLNKEIEAPVLRHWPDSPKDPKSHYHQVLNVPFDSRNWHESADHAILYFRVFIKGLSDFYASGTGKH
jgi:hypothetical protein